VLRIASARSIPEGIALIYMVLTKLTIVKENVVLVLLVREGTGKMQPKM